MVRLTLSEQAQIQLITAIQQSKNALTPRRGIETLKKYFIALMPNGTIASFPSKSAYVAYNAMPLVEFTTVRGVIQWKAISEMADERMMATVRATQ